MTCWKCGTEDCDDCGTCQECGIEMDGSERNEDICDACAEEMGDLIGNFELIRGH